MKGEKRMKPFRTEIAKSKKNGRQFFAEYYGVGMDKIKVVLTDEFGQKKTIKFETYLNNYERA
jgi:hypothetical protein